MPRRQASTLVFACAFVVLGLPDFAHGVAWPAMRAEFHRPLADLGVFLVAQAVGYLTVAMGAGSLAARWTVEGLVVRSTVTCCAALAIIAAAPLWIVVLVGGGLLGAGSGGMDTGFNAAVAFRNDRRLMGFLHAGYGAGAALGPVVVGTSLAAGSGWRPPYAMFAVATGLLIFPLVGRSMGEAPAQETLGSMRGVVLPCLTFFVYVALEVTVGQWAFTFLTDQRGIGDFAASVWVGAYWVGLTAGRLWLAIAGHRMSVDRILATSMVVAVGGSLLLWLGDIAAPIGLPILGLALSVVFPLLMLVTPEQVGAERATAAVGWQTASATAGAAAGPAIAGLVLEAAGVGAYGTVALLMTLALAIAIAIRPRHARLID
jgi:fucose permease